MLTVGKWNQQNRYQDETKVTSPGLNSALASPSLSSCSGTLDSASPVSIRVILNIISFTIIPGSCSLCFAKPFTHAQSDCLHKSHETLEVVDLCCKLGIILFCLHCIPLMLIGLFKFSYHFLKSVCAVTFTKKDLMSPKGRFLGY